MKTTLVLVLAAALAWTADAQVTNLTNQHMDFRLQYNAAATDSNRLDLILGYDPGQRVTNDQVYIVGKTNARTTISANPNYAFLGPAGSNVWILPQTQNTNLPYLGISAEDIPGGVFENPMQLELVSVEGPGNFFVWSVSGVGQPPTVKMIATNGMVSPQFKATEVYIGSHEHNNWGFSTNGLYRVTFRAVGKFLDETTNTLGRDVAWSFQILPLRPWEQWISTNWLPATASTTNGPAADPDGDGVPNVLEYAFGNDPNSALRTNLPACVTVFTNGLHYGALRYIRATNATDLELSVLAADAATGVPWTILTNTFSVVTNGPTEIVTVRDEVPVSGATNRFYQLRVKLNHP